jgi:hypothetical protein
MVWSGLVSSYDFHHFFFGSVYPDFAGDYWVGGLALEMAFWVK